jgi:hypothetical protein
MLFYGVNVRIVTILQMETGQLLPTVVQSISFSIILAFSDVHFCEVSV